MGAHFGAGMGLLSWVLLGGIAGLIARALMGRPRQGCLVDIIVGAIGAVIGGAVFSALGGVGVTGFNVYSLVVAILGAIIFLWLLNLLRRM